MTGESPEKILQAKKKLHDLVVSTKVYVKDVVITASKIDEILLERLDKVRRIIENNGSYVLLPRLGEQRGMVRVQATDILNVERTVREVMSLVRFPSYCDDLWLCVCLAGGFIIYLKALVNGFCL